MNGHLVVLSGGLDSTVLLSQICYEERTKARIQAIHFKYGQRHSDREYIAARTVCASFGVPLQIISLSFGEWGFKSALLPGGQAIPEGEYTEEGLKVTVVPFRNGIMLSIAVGIAASRGLKTVHIAVHAGDRTVYPDCRKEFMAVMSRAINAGTDGNIHLSRPFIEKSKEDIVKLGVEIDAPMGLSYSCYNGRELHCGVCSTCHARKEAFKLAEVPDPTEYEK